MRHGFRRGYPSPTGSAPQPRLLQLAVQCGQFENLLLPLPYERCDVRCGLPLCGGESLPCIHRVPQRLVRRRQLRQQVAASPLTLHPLRRAIATHCAQLSFGQVDQLATDGEMLLQGLLNPAKNQGVGLFVVLEGTGV